MVISLITASYICGQKAVVYRIGGWMPPAGITMVVDGLSMLMLLVMNFVAFMIAVFSMDYVKKYTDSWKFFSLFMLMLSGINGVLVAGDIFNLYVFLEIAAVAGYFLVAFGTGADELEAAFKYAVMGTVASAFILLGIGLLYSHVSTLNMADMSMALAQNGNTNIIRFVCVLFLMGFGLKAALMPFHAWLPYAHSAAPAPISAMLSGVSIKVLGIYALSRIFFNVIGMTPAIYMILIALGVISMVVGSILAFGQTDIKRLFAYSSISQIGYIALGLGVGTPLAIIGALFHLLNHSIFKSLLFLNSGAIERDSGTRDLSKIRDVMARAPVTGCTGLTGALSICGIPPLGGFWSKLIIIFACIQAGRPYLAFTAIAVSALTLAYYFRALTPALFGKAKVFGGDARRKFSLAIAAPMVILAALSVATGLMLLPGAGQELLKNASSVLSAGKDYPTIILGVLR